MLGVLVEAAGHTFLLGVVLQCALCLFRVRQARLLLMTWTIVLAASIAMPVLLRCAPLQLPIATALPGPLIDDAADLIKGSTLPASPAGAVAGPQARPSSASQVPPASWLPAIYLAVACGMVLRVLFGLALSVRLVARAVRIRPDWAAGSHVRVSRDVAGPVTVATVILVPVDALAWSRDTRRAVLAHERAHVARWDFALLVVSQLNRALYWFSPLSWWLHHRLVGLAELASDDQAIALTHDPIGYAEVLLLMARHPGRVLRDLAMARSSTLPRRIDRILSGHVTSCRVGRSQRMLLVAGMVGLCAGIVSLTPDQAPGPAAALFARQQDVPDRDGTTPVSSRTEAGGPSRPGTTILPEPVHRDASPNASPPVTEEAGSGMALPPIPGLPPTSSETGTAQRLHAADPPSSPPAPRASRRTVTAPRPPRARRRADPVAADPGTGDPGLRAPGVEEASPHDADASVLVARQDAAHEDGGPPSSRGIAPGLPSPPSPYSAGNPAIAGRQNLPRGGVTTSPPLGTAFAFPSLPLSPGIRDAADDTCTGTISIGWSASREPNRQPSIVPGQMVPARARFFHKPDGTLWVRFDAFGRPALDLPVHFTKNGMTWVGEYGIAYTVRVTGKGRLAGLASQIARDSATVDLACAKPTGSFY